MSISLMGTFVSLSSFMPCPNIALNTSKVGQVSNIEEIFIVLQKYAEMQCRNKPENESPESPDEHKQLRRPQFPVQDHIVFAL